MKIPVYSADLIEELDRQYPHRCPTLGMTPDMIWFKAGQRAVVDSLLAHLKAQEGVVPDIITK